MALDSSLGTRNQSIHYWSASVHNTEALKNDVACGDVYTVAFYDRILIALTRQRNGFVNLQISAVNTISRIYYVSSVCRVYGCLNR